MSQENQKKKKMDMSKASRGIWLVKVPNYVAQMWQQAPNDMQVATMRMEKSGDDKEPAKVKLILSQDLMQLAPDKLLASEHDLKLCKAIKGARLTGIFSTIDDTDSVMEGWVTHKMECLPICNAQYLKMKQQSIRGVRPMRSAEALNHIVKSYKPVSNHAHNVCFSSRQLKLLLRSLFNVFFRRMMANARRMPQRCSARRTSWICCSRPLRNINTIR